MNILTSMSRQRVIHADHVNVPDKDQVVHVSCGTKYNRCAPLATVHYNPQWPLQAIANAKIIEQAFNVSNRQKKTPCQLEHELEVLKSIIDSIEKYSPEFVPDRGYSAALERVKAIIQEGKTNLLNK